MSNVPMTPWCEEIIRRYKSGVDNAFILSGNIGDYAVENVKLIDYLETIFKNVLNMDYIGLYDPSSQVKKLFGPENFPKQDTFEQMCYTLKLDTQKSAYILTYPNLVIPESPNGYLNEPEKKTLVNLHKAITSTEFMSSDNILIILCESTKDVNHMLISSNVKAALIDITLPTDEARMAFYVQEKENLNFNPSISEVTDKEFINLTAGLSLINIEDILLNAIDQNQLTYKMILDRKKELIRKEHGEIIELFDTRGTSLANFAGQEHIKAFFKDTVIDAIKLNNLKIVPKGVLLMGPPGTGKTYFSNCLAGDAGINFVEFKMSKILDKWVGNAEKNLEKAFSVFRALAPVGVFIDEVDQALSRGDGDSNSVSKNLFGMFLAELSKPENRGKIIWIGATNYPNKIDEALKRSGRFDKKIPFFAPTAPEREAVFSIHFKKTKIKIDETISLKELASKTDGYTQAEIENVVVKSLELSMRRRHDIIMLDDVNDALEYMLPAQNNRIRDMEDIALLECNDLEFLPKEYRERQKELQMKQKEEMKNS